MMERRFTLPSMVRLDPAVIMKNSALLRVAKRIQDSGAVPDDSSRKNSSPRLEKKAVSFDLDIENIQAKFPRTCWLPLGWFDVKLSHPHVATRLQC